jgi:hypothetical protein
VSKSNKYPIPLYLNEQYVFDILAKMEDGFSYLETVKTARSEQADKSLKYSGEFGIKNALAFIGISLGGEKTGKEQTAGSQEGTKEKVHTPSSLFAKMRERLDNEKEVISSNLHTTKPGDFVEFKVVLRKNPLIDALEVFQSLGKLIVAVTGYQQNQSPQKPTRNPNQPKPKAPEVSDKGVANTLQLIDDLLGQLNSSEIVDLIGTSVAEKYINVIILVDRSFLGDSSLSSLVDGEYTVLGKVTRNISVGNEEKIDLLRNNALGKMQAEALSPLVDSFKNANQFGIKLPEIITEIEGPALQVIPIAIFI